MSDIEKYPIDENRQAELDNWFVYHAPIADQLPRYQAIRDKAKEFAELICKTTPKSADQTAALRHLRECVMTANAAIACGEK